jgi:transposase
LVRAQAQDQSYGKQRFRLRELLRYNLKTARAYLLKEDFQQFWEYQSATWAGKFLDDWCQQVMCSRIQPMKKIAATMRSHSRAAPQLFPSQVAALERRSLRA